MKRLSLLIIGVALSVGPALAQDVCAPAKVTTLATTTSYGTIKVTWNATGDDCSTGNATSYEVRVSTASFSEADWQGQSTQLWTGSSAANGSQNCRVKQDEPCATTTFYFAVFVIDEAGNRSPMSDVVTGSARCSAPFDIDECP